METFLIVLGILALALWLGHRTFHRVGRRPESAGSQFLTLTLLVLVVLGLAYGFRVAAAP